MALHSQSGGTLGDVAPHHEVIPSALCGPVPGVVGLGRASVIFLSAVCVPVRGSCHEQESPV